MHSSDPEKDPQSNRLHISFITITSIAAILISLYCLYSGSFVVFQNFFYIPIVLSCMYYAMRGFIYSVCLAVLYMILILIFTSESGIIMQALVRVVLFIGIAGVVAFLSTQRKEVMQKLRESETKYRALFENAVEGIFQTTPEGRLISANPAQAKLLGYDSPKEYMEQITDLTRQQYVNPKDRETFKNTLEVEGAIRQFETQLLNKDGIPLWASISARAVRNDAGAIIYYEGFVENITERKMIEEEREKLILELRNALTQVKILHGLLPICASCKKIRNDKGYWEQMEVYIRDNSEADFTHSICPECAEKMYPEFYKKRNE